MDTMYQPQIQSKRTRIVGSLSTLPSRLFCCIHAIKSILSQTMPLDALYLNLPYVTLKGKQYIIPTELEMIAANDKRLIINRCGADLGPITKIIPTLELETDPDTRIITFDDDVLIDPNVVEILMKKSLGNEEACFSFSGWCVGKLPFIYQRVINAKTDQKCDWIQGVHCIIYKRSMLDMNELMKFRRLCPADIAQILWMNDDHWLSGYLASRGIGRIAVGAETTKFFIDLETFAHQEDSISRRASFYGEVYRVGEYFRKKGYYGLYYRPEMSFLFASVCMVPMFLTGIFVIKQFVPAVPELIILNILLCCLWYTMIRSSVVEPFVSPRMYLENNGCASS